MVRSASLGLSTSCLLDLPSCLFSCTELNWFSGINGLHCSNFLVLYAVYLQFGLRSWTILYIVFWSCLIRVMLNVYFTNKAGEFISV